MEEKKKTILAEWSLIYLENGKEKEIRCRGKTEMLRQLCLLKSKKLVENEQDVYIHVCYRRKWYPATMIIIGDTTKIITVGFKDGIEMV